MDPVTMRRYEGEPDLAPMQALLRADPSPFDIYPSASDLPAVLDPSVSDTPDHTALWEDAQGDLVGFAMVTQCGNLHARFSPREWMEKVGPELVAWAVARLHLRAGNVTGLTLNAVARDDDALMTHFFVEHGFGEVPDSTFHMSRSLDRVLPTVDLPSGFSLRPLDGDSEVPAYVAVHRAAYGTEKMTEELRRSIMHQPHYDPALDLVVVAPDGRLAAAHRGFRETGHGDRPSRLDVQAANIEPGQRAADRLKGEGIRIATLAELGGDREDLLHGIHELAMETYADKPRFEDLTSMPFDDWQRIRAERGERSDMTWVAMDGSRFVGIATLLQQHPDSARAGYTGVSRAYRGRGIARALKYFQVEWARGHEIRYLFTENDVQNAPMLRINTDIGYKPLPVDLEVVKDTL